MPSNWTRAHDAWIAEHCEGIEAWIDEWGACSATGRISHYLTDTAAAIRAAEAWRKKKEGRYYETRSAISDSFGDKPACACCFNRYPLIAGTGETLAEALYNATGGPA